MELSYTKFIKTMIALSGMEAGELAKRAGLNRSTLSREISKKTYLTIRHFFEKHDIEVVEAIDLIIEHFEWDMFEDVEKLWLNEPEIDYRKNNPSAVIRHLQTRLRDKEKIEALLENDKRKLQNEVAKLEMELSEINRPNKQTG